jgi:hypothetical protein
MAIGIASLGSQTARSSFTVKMECKNLFFDRGRVIRSMDKATREAMQRAAKFIRRRAQTSMRYVTSLASQQRQLEEGARKRVPLPYTPSRPGEPPVAVRPHPWVRKHIRYYYNPRKKAAVIGPVGFPSGSGAPHALEFGGLVLIRDKRRRERKLGDGGEIRIGGRPGVTTKPAINKHGLAVMVTYARLVSARMVQRANMLNQLLYGDKESKRKMAARPFMGPALATEAAAGNIPRLWQNSVRG